MDTLIAFIIALMIAIILIPIALTVGVIICVCVVLFEIAQIIYKIATRDAETPDQR